MKKILHPGTLILIGFVAMILFILSIFLSVDKDDFQLVTDNYYEKEKDFQSQLDAEKRGIALKDSAKLDIRHGELYYQIPQSLMPGMDSIYFNFYHIFQTALDRKVVVPVPSTGVDSFPCSFTKGKPYEVSMEFTSDSLRYILKKNTP